MGLSGAVWPIWPSEGEHGIVIRGRARQLVEEMGWRPERTVDINVIVHEMDSVGFDKLPSSLRFLAAFSGLRIEHPPSIEVNDQKVWSRTAFESKLVCAERDSRIASRCAEIASESLCPVGIDSFHMTIYVSPSMRFFAGMDSSVYEYGDSVDEFFTRLAGEEKPVLMWSWEL